MGRSRNRVRELIKSGALPATRVLNRGRVWWLISERDFVRLASQRADLEHPRRSSIELGRAA
jgi:hypothetical protein